MLKTSDEPDSINFPLVISGVENGQTAYAEVILPLPLQRNYTYRIPSELMAEASVGKRVVVQFGNQKLYAALIYRIHDEKPEHYDVKEIISVIDAFPVVTPKQFEFWKWISGYYLCTLGEVMAAALPSGMKMESESIVMLHPDFDGDLSQLSESEYSVFKVLEHEKGLSILKLSKALGRRNIIPLISSMIEKGVLIRKEELKGLVKPEQTEVVTLTEAAGSEEFLRKVFDAIEKRAPKQLQLLLHFIKMMTEKPDEPVLKKKLLSQTGCKPEVLNQLQKRGVLEVHQLDAWLLKSREKHLKQKPVLSAVQKEAYEKIQEGWKTHLCALLHGVTSSGKTEIYIRLIEEQAALGKQVLYLLPEIALTAQIIIRLKKYFGDRLLVYHSKSGERERVTVWNSMMHYHHHRTAGDYQVIIGARSALFLPFSNPGLVIIDEEHDSSYKQVDPAPRYHARDAGIMLAHLQGAKVLLGSATPSIESYYNAVHHKYALIKLSQRHKNMALPVAEVVDLKEAARKKKLKSVFSELLIERIRQTLAEREQVILFQNRRGFALVLECQNCHWVPHCVHCDVTLTYHKKSDKLVCHYCGYAQMMQTQCAACGSQHLKMIGYGTERIEDELSLLFPEARIARLDLDTTRSRAAYQQILQSFENREIDILAGTQMVTKGLDFSHVNLVGVINADNMLNFPDFRSAEKCFQLLMQVSGRAGRRDKQGRVVIQSWQPSHPVIELAKNNDYEGFFNLELKERLKFNYPPFYRLIELRLKHRHEKKLEENATAFTEKLKLVFGNRVLGPVIPHISRIRNYYLRTILIKAERSLLPGKIKQMLGEVMDTYLLEPENRSLIIQADVDPI